MWKRHEENSHRKPVPPECSVCDTSVDDVVKVAVGLWGRVEGGDHTGTRSSQLLGDPLL